jgi:thiamine monophosphate synthase
MDGAASTTATKSSRSPGKTRADVFVAQHLNRLPNATQPGYTPGCVTSMRSAGAAGACVIADLMTAPDRQLAGVFSSPPIVSPSVLFAAWRSDSVL